MRSQSCLRRSRTALLSLLPFTASRFAPRALRRLLALAMVLLLLPLTQEGLFAQQAWPQSPQYPNPQYAQTGPSYAQYPQNQQPVYPQQPYPQQPYPQQAYPQQAYPDPGQYDPQSAYAQPQASAQPFNPDLLEQLVAPIALYPDTLVAQILAAATYPAQVVAADQWLRAQGYASPDQIAAGADAQPTWDPSIKALTAFPQVLALMDRDLAWTTDLGNAYYNQPQDVLDTVQVMRQRAQNAGTLQNTPQQAVSYNQGYIQLAPVNPQVVYVPAYNPWDVYGQSVSPYPGFSLLGALQSFAGSAPVKFGLGMAMNAFSHTPFGWAGWALNWLTSSVLFHQSNYVSNSTSVARWAAPRGGSYYASQSGGINRQPNGFYGPEQGYSRPANGYTPPAFTRPPVRNPENYTANRPVETPNRGFSAPNGNYVRPAVQNYAYSRPEPQATLPARPQTYARPGGYGSGFYSGSQQAYAARPSTAYANPQQSWRAPASTYQRNDFAQRSYSQSYPEARSYSAGRNFAESSPKSERSGGFHLFGGDHNAESSHASYHAPKAPRPPKGYGGGGHHSGGGGHHSGGGLFSHHR